jgi:hypothetical protein
MAKRIIFGFWVVVLALLPSCITLYFAEPVPFNAKQVNTLPKPIWGEWKKENETHIISRDKWINHWVDSTGKTFTKIEHKLSDSLIIKKDGKYHYINKLEENGYYTIYLGLKQKNLFIIKSLGDTDTLLLSKTISITPDSSTAKEYFYRAPISKKQMRTFIKRGGFTDTLLIFDLKTRTLIN